MTERANAARTATPPRLDHLPTLVAAAAAAYVLSMLAHEALGHGGACLLAGGRVTALWALDLGCDLDATAAIGARTRAVAAAGPLVPLALGLLLWTVPQRSASSADGRTTLAFILRWLGAAFLILPNVGYLWLSLATFGDASIALRGTPWAVRAAASAAGVALYWATARTLFRRLRAALGAEPEDAWRRGRRIAWTAYLSANALAVAVAARQIGASSATGLSGWSGALASLAGTSGLLWGVVALRRAPTTSGPALPPLHRNAAVAVAALALALLFVGVLGPGLHLGS